MSIRKEVDQKNEEKIYKLLENQPDLLRKYVISVGDRTSYTKVAYVRHISHFLTYMNKELKYDNNKISDYLKVKPMDISSYMESIKYDESGNKKSATYYNTQLAAIKSFFEFLMYNNIIENNPCDKVKKAKDNKEREIVTITDDDLDIMINNIKNGVGNHRAKAIQKKWVTRDIALLTMGLTTGLRISAIVGIDIDDINFDEKYLVVTEKGDIEKKIYLGDRTIKALKDWINDRQFMVDSNVRALFLSKNYKRISTTAVQERFRKISEDTGKHITPHKMRATCATRLYEETGDIYLVQQQLGHKSIKNTERYAKVSDERKIKAANILDSLY